MPQHNSLLFQQKTNSRRKRYYTGADISSEISPLIGRLAAYCISDRINLISLQDYFFSTSVSTSTNKTTNISIDIDDTLSNFTEPEIRTYISPRESFIVTLNNNLQNLKTPLLAMVEKPKENYFGFSREHLLSTPYSGNETGYILPSDPNTWIKLLGKNICMFLDGDMVYILFL